MKIEAFRQISSVKKAIHARQQRPAFLLQSSSSLPSSVLKKGAVILV